MRLSHIGWNFGGLSIPLLVAAATVPALIERLGNERFGLLALAWGLIGYAGALDLGIGRALTQLVARMRGDGQTERVSSALATAGRITLMSGALGGLITGMLALIIEPSWVGATETPSDEIRLSMLLMAIALPAQAMSATYRGFNEAYENFKGISVLRIGLGIVNFGGPYLVSIFTVNIAALISTIVISRLSALAIYRYLAYTCVASGNVLSFQYSRHLACRLLSFGGWVTVSSVVSPILVQADRFIIGAVISAAAITTYVVPYEVVVQSLIVVGAVSTVAFPSIARRMREQPSGWRSYFYRWLVRVALLMMVVCLTISFMLPTVLELWIGEALDPQSIVVGQILCIGVFANSVGSMFFAKLHAQGRSDLTAKLHILELPLFLFALLALLPTHGIVAAAWIWVARMTFDATALAWLGLRR